MPPAGQTMPGDDVSSANPDALFAYAETGLRIDAQREASAVRLAAILDEFAATCTEYPLGIDGRVADGMRDWARRDQGLNLWVRQVAEEFQRADASGTPEPVAFVTPQPSPVPEPVSTPTVPPAETGPTAKLPAAWDYWLSRSIDGATEAFKAAVKPQWVTRLAPQVVEFTQRAATTVLTEDQQVVAFTTREFTEWVIGLRPVKELANEPAVAIKDFLASPGKGVPLIGGVVQGVTDWLIEPDLTTTQRIGRIVVAGVLATGAALVVTALAPEELLGGGVAIGGGLVLNAIADWQIKPRIFDLVGLNAPKSPEGVESAEATP